MRSLEDFEDLNEAVLSGRVAGVDVAEDQFQPAFVDEALDEAVEVVAEKRAVSTIGFAHDVDDEAARFCQLDHLPKGGRHQVSFRETAGARHRVVLRHCTMGWKCRKWKRSY